MNEMNVQIPDILRRYYEAKNAHNVEEMTDCFATDALVHDEGKDIRGKEAIRQWIARTTEQYRAQVEVKEAKEEGHRVNVTARVSGNFDGSPLEMYYAFGLKDGMIATLGIDA